MQMLSIAALADTPKASNDVSDYITEKNIVSITQNGKEVTESTKIDSAKEVDATFSFRVPVVGDRTYENTVKLNDTATLQLSDGFNIVSDLGNVTLKQNGTKVGTLSLSNDSASNTCKANVVFDGDPTIFDGSDNGNGVWSDVVCNFTCRLKYDGSGENGSEGDHIVSIYNKNFTVNVAPKPYSISGEKTGAIDSKDKKTIDWKVKVVAKKGDNDADIKGFLFSDDLSSVGTYEDSSFKIGAAADGSDAVAKDALYSENTLKYTFPEGTSGTKYIFYKTKVSDDLYFKNTNTTINNTAKISNGSDINVSFSGSVPYKTEWIKKETASVDNTTGKVTFNITANTLGSALTNAKITDVLDSKLEWESAQLKTYDSDTKKWVESGEISFSSQPLNGIYDIKNINTPVMLTIVAKLKFDGNSLNTVDNYDFNHKIFSVNNTATLSWDENAGIKSNTVSSNIGNNPILKLVGSGGYNAKDHTIPWDVTVKKSDVNERLRVVDLLFYDKSGFDANRKSYTIEGNAPDGDIANISNDDLKKATVQYNQMYKENSFASTDNMELKKYTVKENGKAVADLLVITGKSSTPIDVLTSEQKFSYSTVVLNPSIYLSNNSTSVHNTATLFSANEVINYSTANCQVNSKMLSKDAMKRTDAQKDLTILSNVNTPSANDSECFDYKDKSCVYRLYVNKNGDNDVTEGITADGKSTVGNISVTDTLPNGWKFQNVSGDSKFLIYEVNPNTNTATNLVSEPTFLKDDFETEGTAKFTFTKLSKPYVILLKAGPDDATQEDYFSKNNTINATNNAELTAENVTVSAKGSKNANITSTIINKTVPNTATDGSVRWNIEYKPYDIENDNNCIVDTLPQGLDLRQKADGSLDFDDGNVTITKLSLNADGSYKDEEAITPVEGKDGNLSWNAENRQLTFKFADKKTAYRLTYITDITTNKPIDLYNNAQLNEASPLAISKSAKFIVTSYYADATMHRSGSLIINTENNLGTKLAGAEFSVYTEDGKTVIRKCITDDNGNLKIYGLPVGNYTLKETKAPDGYTIIDKVNTVTVAKTLTGISTQVNGKTGSDKNTLTVIHFLPETCGDLSITHAISGNAADKNQDFKITITSENLNDTFDYVGSGSKEDGTITFKNGKAEITLKDSEGITIKNLPKDAQYEIVEDDYTDDGYNTATNNCEGVIVPDTVSTASIVDTKNVIIPKPVGSLTISNTVAGNGGDKKDEFEFKVVFDNTSEEFSYVGTGVANGTIKSGDTIKLSHGESILITGIPALTTYSVTEKDYSSDGYTLTSTGSKGTIEENKISQASFCNTKNLTIKKVKNENNSVSDNNSQSKIENPKTGNMSDIYFEALLLLSMVFTAVLFFIRIRSKS